MKMYLCPGTPKCSEKTSAASTSISLSGLRKHIEIKFLSEPGLNTKVFGFVSVPFC